MKSFLILCCCTALFFSTAATAEAWRYYENIDEFTDNKEFNAISMANSGNGYIVVRCKNNELEIILNNGEFIGSSASKWRYRIDKGDVFNRKGQISTNNKSLFVINHDKKTLLKQLTKGESLLIDITNYRDVSHSATFSLEGSSKALTPVLDACDFKLE